MTARVSMLLKSCVSLTYFRACFSFLVGLRTYQHPGGLSNLIPWTRVLPEKLTDSQPVKKLLVFYGTRRFITVSTSASYNILSADIYLLQPRLKQTKKKMEAVTDRHKSTRVQPSPVLLQLRYVLYNVQCILQHHTLQQRQNTVYKKHQYSNQQRIQQQIRLNIASIN